MGSPNWSLSDREKADRWKGTYAYLVGRFWSWDLICRGGSVTWDHLSNHCLKASLLHLLPIFRPHQWNALLSPSGDFKVKVGGYKNIIFNVLLVYLRCASFNNPYNEPTNSEHTNLQDTSPVMEMLFTCNRVLLKIFVCRVTTLEHF